MPDQQPDKRCGTCAFVRQMPINKARRYCGLRVPPWMKNYVAADGIDREVDPTSDVCSFWTPKNPEEK